jgi:hypothetical protein
VLTFDAFDEVTQESEKTKQQNAEMIKQIKGLRESYDYLKTKVYRMIELWNLSQQNFEGTFLKEEKKSSTSGEWKY